MAVLDDHHPVGVMAPAVIAMCAKFAMFAILGAGVAITIAIVIAMLDNDGFGAGDRRHRNSNGNDGRDDISKLPHEVLLLCCKKISISPTGTFPGKTGEYSEQMFRLAGMSSELVREYRR